jgi:hypothetical protein
MQTSNPAAEGSGLRPSFAVTTGRALQAQRRQRWQMQTSGIGQSPSPSGANFASGDPHGGEVLGLAEQGKPAKCDCICRKSKCPTLTRAAGFTSASLPRLTARVKRNRQLLTGCFAGGGAGGLIRRSVKGPGRHGGHGDGAGNKDGDDGGCVLQPGPPFVLCKVPSAAQRLLLSCAIGRILQVDPLWASDRSGGDAQKLSCRLHGTFWPIVKLGRGWLAGVLVCPLL